MEQLLKEENAIEEPIWSSSLRIIASGRESPAATQIGKEALCLIVFFKATESDSQALG